MKHFSVLTITLLGATSINAHPADLEVFRRDLITNPFTNDNCTITFGKFLTFSWIRTRPLGLIHTRLSH